MLHRRYSILQRICRSRDYGPDVPPAGPGRQTPLMLSMFNWLRSARWSASRPRPPGRWSRHFSGWSTDWWAVTYFHGDSILSGGLGDDKCRGMSESRYPRAALAPQGRRAPGSRCAWVRDSSTSMPLSESPPKAPPGLPPPQCRSCRRNWGSGHAAHIFDHVAAALGQDVLGSPRWVRRLARHEPGDGLSAAMAGISSSRRMARKVFFSL